MQKIAQKKEEISLPFFIDQDEDGVFVAESAVFDWCVTQWYDIAELKDNIEEVSQLYFWLLKDGEKVLKGRNLVYLWFDKNAKITNTLSENSYQNIREKMIHLG